MPAILPPEAEELWLDPYNTSDALAALLAPYAGAIAAVEEKPKPVMNTRGGIRRRDPQGDLFGGG
jgi:putative SOS response-associated peptidase YedK